MSREKQIEEMAKDLCGSTMCDLETYNRCRMSRGNCSRCQRVAEALYNAGYRKQSVGEWGYDGMSWTCSECGEYAPIDKHRNTRKSKFCPNCGAHMRGGKNEQHK